MKNTLKVAFALILIFWAIFTYNLYQGYCKLENRVNQLEKTDIHLIWNDDEESIPKDGSLIRIEMTDENTVYIGPTE